MILAIGNSSDTEFAAYKLIERSIEERGMKVVLFRQDRCLLNESIIFRASNRTCGYFVTVDGVEYCLDDFESILYMHPQIPKELMRYDPYEHANFIHHQFKELRKGIWLLLKDKKWINDPWNIQKAENKSFQLTLANKVGFRIPDTVMTSDPDVVTEFYKEREGKIITKIIIPAPILDHVIYTNRVTDEQMEGIDSVRMCPSIFQAEIDKAYELRITVVGDKIFPAKVLSQENSETSLDWRKTPKTNDHSVKIVPCELPTNILNKIKNFMKEIGLRYGCIDMVVTPKGEYIFLEINPSGQWYFIQLKTSMDIASAIVDLVL